MLRFPAENFIGAVTVIADLAGRLDADGIDPNQVIPVANSETIKPLLIQVRDLTAELDLPVSLRLIDNIIENLASGYSVRRLRRSLSELRNRLVHEIEISPVILRVEKDNVRFLKERPFGTLVYENFPSSADDINEAAKCLAFERSTACVMHLQKVVESALTAFVSYAQLPPEVLEKLRSKDPNWGNIMTPMREVFKDRDRDAVGWPHGVDGDYCQSVRAFGDSVRIAWRNPAMHFGRHYSHEEAVDIFHAVKGFMRTLAKRINESGEGIGRIAVPARSPESTP